MDVQEDVGSYNIGSLIAHGNNEIEETLQHKIIMLYGELEDIVRKRYRRNISSKIVPLYGDIHEKLFDKLFNKTYIVSACNFGDKCLSSSNISTIDMCDSNRVLQDIFKKSLQFYNSIYDEKNSLYCSQLILRLIRVFYLYHEFIIFYQTNNIDLTITYKEITIPDDLTAILLMRIHYYFVRLVPDKYVNSVLFGVTSILKNIEKVNLFIRNNDTIEIVRMVNSSWAPFHEFIDIINENIIRNLERVEPAFGLHTITEKTSVKFIVLNDDIRLDRGLHVSNIKNIDNDIVIGMDSELSKMIDAYPDKQYELIKKYITTPFTSIMNNKFEDILYELIDIIKSNNHITNAHVLLFMLLLNFENENLIILSDFSCNNAANFDEITRLKRAPIKKISPDGFGVRNTNKIKNNLKKRKTVNNRKQLKKTKRRKSTYA